MLVCDSVHCSAIHKWYNASMYEVGTKIDLTSLNTKHEAASQAPKKSSIEQAFDNATETQGYYQAGTRFTFDKETLALRRRIRVDFP